MEKARISFNLPIHEGDSVSFTLNDLASYRFDPQKIDRRLVEATIAAAGFRNEKNVFALISFGGTISSQPGSGPGGIQATPDNKAFDLFTKLKQKFSLVSTKYTGISLLAKDSREISPGEVRNLLDFLNSIQNRRILVTCGTYLLPEFARAADKFIRGPKIVAFTGSMLIETATKNDIAVNVAGAVTAVNALDAVKVKTPHVFVTFHGECYSGTSLETLTLHSETA